MVRTYGGREAEGARGGTFSIEVSEIIYWVKFRRADFWDTYMSSFEIECDMERSRPERRRRTKEMVEEFFEEHPEKLEGDNA